MSTPPYKIIDGLYYIHDGLHGWLEMPSADPNHPPVEFLLRHYSVKEILSGVMNHLDTLKQSEQNTELRDALVLALANYSFEYKPEKV